MKKLKADVIKLDLACGNNKREGFIGVDIAKTPSVDIVCDLQKYPWDFLEDNSVDEIFASHYIEHLPDIIPFMEEVYRVLKPAEFDPKNPNQPIRGFATFLAPYANSNRYWQDPTHKQPIVHEKFFYFNKGWREANKLDHYPITCDFDFTSYFHLNKSLEGRSQEYVQFALQHYQNAADDIVVTVMKRK